MPTDTKYLKRRGHTYYAQINIPPKLQTVMGKRVLIRSLKTRDLVEANKRKHSVIADMHTEIDRYSGDAIGWESPTNIITDARLAHREVVRGEIGAEDAMRKWSIGVYEFEDHHEITPAQNTAIVDSFRILEGESLLTVSEALVHHLEEIEPRVLVKTYKTRKVRINNLIDVIGDMQLISVTKLQARQYVLAQSSNVPIEQS